MPMGRLTRKKDFDHVFRRGRSYFDSIIGVKHLSNGLPGNRYGVIVSSKVSKKAVDRNRIKRQIRAAIRENAGPEGKGQDLVFIALPLILSKKYQEISDSIRRHLSRAGRGERGNSLR